MKKVILDVRESDEYGAEHAEGAIHVPLSSFGTSAPSILKELKDKKIVLMCKSGTRAKMAYEQAVGSGFCEPVALEIFSGGIDEWKRQGNPTVTTKMGHLPIMRQVQLIAGLLVLGSVLGGIFVNPWFLAVTAFVGSGLTLAGSTGICLMAELLARMPWNRYEGVKKELCEASPGGGSCHSK